MKPDDQHSIHHEPHLNSQNFQPDPSEKSAEEPSFLRHQNEEEAVEHSVWDEPALAKNPTKQNGDPELNYRSFIEKKRNNFNSLDSWLYTIIFALAAGPLGVIGAFWGSGSTGFGSLILVVLVGPLTEEFVKVMLPLIYVEKKPWLFISAKQVLFCALAGGLMFGVLENLIYLNIYIPNADSDIAIWRWTVCTTLHTGCSFIAGLGIRNMWLSAWKEGKRPSVSIAYPYLITATAIHGAYNFIVTVLEISGIFF